MYVRLVWLILLFGGERVNKSAVIDIFKKIPTLKTDRLILRRMKVSDASDMYEYAHLEKVTEYLLWSPHVSVQQTSDYLHFIQKSYRDGDFYDWAVTLRDTGKMIGTCGFTRLDFNHNLAEIGYVLNPDFWGHGIAAEAVKRVMEFAFMELNVHRVEAKYMVGNDASRRVMEKCGMTFEGVYRSSMFIKGMYRDIGVCSIISDEYMAIR